MSKDLQFALSIFQRVSQKVLASELVEYKMAENMSVLPRVGKEFSGC